MTSIALAATDEALNEQDLLVVVARDPEGPLAGLAFAGLNGAVPAVVVPPLRRGPARALASAGVRAATPVRRLLEAAQEEET